MRLVRALFVSSLLGSAAAAMACGTTRPDPAEPTSRDAGAPTDASGAGRIIGVDPSADASGALCTGPADAAPLPEASTSTGCSCDAPISASISIALPCGFALCNVDLGEAAVCGMSGQLTLLPIEAYPPCANPDGGADPGTLPPCDAGTADGGKPR